MSMKKKIQEPRRSIHSTWQTWNAVLQSALLNPFVFLDKNQMTMLTKKKLCSGVMVFEWMRLQSAKPLTDPSPNSAPQDLRGMKWCWLHKKQISTTKQPLLLLKSTMWVTEQELLVLCPGLPNWYIRSDLRLYSTTLPAPLASTLGIQFHRTLTTLACHIWITRI